MKRTIEFQVLDEKYLFVENNVQIFEVNKLSKQIDVKLLYDAFFANGKDYSEIEFDYSQEISKEDKRIFDAISSLITNICSRLKIELSSAGAGLIKNEPIDSYKISQHSEKE